MRIAEVVGTVTLNRVHPNLVGARLRLVVPLTLADLAGDGDKSAGEFAVFDELGAGIGSLIAVSEGREAAMPFYPDVKPIDAYNAAILDQVEIDSKMMNDDA